MTDTVERDDDLQFKQLFQNAAPVEDAGFTESVGRQIRRPVWIRRTGLCLVLAASILLITGPLWLAVGAFSDSLIMLADNWNDREWLLQNQGSLLAALTVLVTPFAIRWLEN